MIDVLAVILGGGKGTRLYPLTKVRSKPAVPIAGKYRIIDIPVSNCLNSDIYRIFVLTQFNSASLNRHVSRAYHFSSFSRGFVDILAAEQTMENPDWFQGTADAVRQNMLHILSREPTHVLILSGDQLYRMDYRMMHAQHVESGADLTVAALPVPPSRASSFGILKVNSKRRVQQFHEKPKDKALIEEMASPAGLLEDFGIVGRGKEVLASMGIYLFNSSALVESLRDKKLVDFGHDVIPRAIQERKVFAFLFGDYWEDIGTIKAFFQANLDLTADRPRLNLFDSNFPIYTHPRFLPGSKVHRCNVFQSIIADGSVIQGATIHQSVIGVRSVIGEETSLRRTLLMGADFFDKNPRAHPVKLGIGKGCDIQNTIIDKNARIGPGVKIRDHSRSPDFDGPDYCIRDGLVVIPKDATIKEGTVI